MRCCVLRCTVLWTCLEYCRYECRVGAAALYKLWDRDGNGKLELREIVSALVLNGIRHTGLTMIIQNEALLSSVGHRQTALEQRDLSS